jgi:hypothetical protein
MHEFNTKDFSGQVTLVKVSDIRPSDHNPRGFVDRNDSFERLAASISRVGVLVPIVVAPDRTGTKKYELVDGERRFLAATEAGREKIPAHVLKSGDSNSAELKKLMFHLHMTREQWDAMAQCRSLIETYPVLKKGIKIPEKAIWVKRLATETGMPFTTARDRVHVLAWGSAVKDKVFEYDQDQRNQPKPKDVYSYVLALEASIIEPSLKTFPDLYNHGRDLDDVANEFRDVLFRKLVDGMEHGLINSREQIRAITPLFSPSLAPAKHKVALNLFKDFVKTVDLQFDDVRAEISTRLPELLQENPPKPQRVTSVMLSVERILAKYDPAFFSAASPREQTRKKIKSEFLAAAKTLGETLEKAIKRLA